MASEQPHYAIARDRAVVAVAGDDARNFLQGIVSNDVDKVTPERALWAAFLTPQGKYLHDFFVAEIGGALYLDCEAARRDDLVTRLRRYRLRSKVTVEPDDGFVVVLCWGGDALAPLNLPAEPGAAHPLDDGIAFADPRLTAAGARAILPESRAEELLRQAGFEPGDNADWDRLRLSLGLPDGSRDIEVEKATLVESNFDLLHGVDWDKGCYMGQELTARTHYRGLVKKRLVPVRVEGPTPAPGTPAMRDGKEVGTVRSGNGDHALALLRLESLEGGGAPLTAGDATLTPEKPGWATF